MNTQQVLRDSRVLLLAAALLVCGLLAPVQAQMCKLPPGGNPGCGGDSASQSGPNPPTGVGNPVDLTSGNKYQRETDIELPGDLPLGFQRHYNSVQTSIGALGAGWSHTYETRLSRTENRAERGADPHEPHTAPAPQITVYQGDGREIRFVPLDATATMRRYRSSPAGYGLIEEDLGAIERLRAAAGSPGNDAAAMRQAAVWKWVWANNRTLTFDGRGLLKSIEQADGRALQVQFDAQRRLSKVTDAYGNWLAASYWDAAQERLQNYAAADRATNRGAGFRGRLKALTLSNGEKIQYEYDVRGNLSDVVYADGTLRRYEYDRSSGRSLLSKIYGRDGRLFGSYAYDVRGHATGSTHPDHRDDVQLTYEWPAPRQSVGRTIVEAAGTRTTYTWRADPGAESPLLLKADGPGCRTCAAGNVRYEYDARGRVSTVVSVDAAGRPLERSVTAVDELGRMRTVEKAQFADGRLQPPYWRETREYVGDGLQPVRITRPSIIPGRDHTLDVEYNERGQPTRIVEKGYEFLDLRGVLPAALGGAAPAGALERVTTLKYARVHGLSLLAGVDGPLAGSADSWSYHYDARGQLHEIVHPTGLIERFEHDAFGRVTAHSGLDGVRETLEYGPRGRISRFARGETWMTFAYDEAGRIAGVIDSLGQHLTLERNDAGELTQISDPAGNRIHWLYGDRGRLSEVTLLNPDGSLSQRRHVTAGAPGADPGQSAAAPGEGLPNEAMLSAVAGALPDEVAAAMPALRGAPEPGTMSVAPVRMGATGAGPLPARYAQYFEAGAGATSYVYDDFGRMTLQHSPVTGTTRYRWDAADHLIERTGADDSPTRITRDALGRAVKVSAGDEEGRIEWGAANRPVRVTFRAGEERFEYDSQARLTAHVLAVDGHQFRIAYEFDELGRVLRRRLPDGAVLRYRYNGPASAKPGVLAGIYLEGMVNRPILTGLNSAAERFADRTFTFGNGLVQHQVLDPDGRPLSAGNAAVAQSRLDWGGTRTSPATYVTPLALGEAAPADVIPALGDRVTSRLAELGAAGQAESASSGSAVSAYSVSGGRFDARGQLLQDSQRRYEWDALGRLTAVFKKNTSGFIQTSTAATPAGTERVIGRYRYNLFGERIAKSVYGQSGVKYTYFLWDGPQLAAEMDASGRVTREYVHLEDRPVAMLSGRSLYAIHTDHRMAPMAVTDSTRRVVWQASVHDNGASDVRSGGAVDLPLRASNQYFDAETGLHYNVHRYLDATQGRYLSPDPMGLAAGPDLYQFVLGRPHEFVDPLGLQATTKDWSQASYNDKFAEIIKRTIPLVPGEIGAALQQLIQPKTLAVMAGVFAVFAGLQATPIGWIADVAILGYSAWQFGSGLGLLIKTFLQLNSDTKAAKCDADLTAAAQRLAAGFVSGGGQVAGGLAGVWGVKSGGGITRIANGITTLVDYARSALGITEEGLVLEGAAGASPGTAALKAGLGGTVTQSEAGITWATDVSGIKAQGLEYEKFVESKSPAGTELLPPNFKTFDLFDEQTGVATSVKTLNTGAPGYTANPGSIYSALTKYLNQIASFQEYTLSGKTLEASQITARDLQLAVPSSTNAAQWAQISRALTAAQSMGINVTVTVVTP